MITADLIRIFMPGVPALEIILRGTAVYWFIFIIFRLVLRRDVGSLGIADILLLVLIADASQNAMSANYDTVTDGFVLIATLVFWSFLLDWLSFNFPRFEHFIQPPPLCLVREGRVLHRNLRRELLTVHELMAKLRESGVENIAQVRRAYMESDGTISVIKHEA
ncbi:MAG TPA: YetF domain-containing protein [Rhodocyclaceae bacterium]|nr:YetF domain-containing protein [Rhodocyclaceae bacterium]